MESSLLICIVIIHSALRVETPSKQVVGIGDGSPREGKNARQICFTRKAGFTRSYTDFLDTSVE